MCDTYFMVVLPQNQILPISSNFIFSYILIRIDSDSFYAYSSSGSAVISFVSRFLWNLCLNLMKEIVQKIIYETFIRIKFNLYIFSTNGSVTTLLIFFFRAFLKANISEYIALILTKFSK